ncbi:hypothetical protein BDP55DRAFT_628475 [Colletotrichum godetiae]|uniref:Uncharacterized protein n=1 Tax=Colletotrichum godetiae TaxID=1209918 RepID=A0AAJ0AT89_9PEZI|nr:uncharacterized protein BDP55DRAFT_628475 [Colletotrichum godetiae]KAK1689940.1 hypothetical protein BDP55DRAFT_628475 [Colletotrichum godetiae]
MVSPSQLKGWTIAAPCYLPFGVILCATWLLRARKLGEKQGSPIEFAYDPGPGAWGLESGETAAINNVVSWSTDDVHKDRRSPGRARPTREYATQNPFFNDIQARVVQFDIITAAFRIGANRALGPDFVPEYPYNPSVML